MQRRHAHPNASTINIVFPPHPPSLRRDGKYLSTPVHSTLVRDAIVRSELSVIAINLDDDRARHRSAVLALHRQRSIAFRRRFL
jgi:hypothetical protein